MLDKIYFRYDNFSPLIFIKLFKLFFWGGIHFDLPKSGSTDPIESRSGFTKRNKLIYESFLEDVLPDVLDEVGEGGLPGVHLDDLDPVDDLAHETDAHVRLVRCLHAQVPDLVPNPG